MSFSFRPWAAQLHGPVLRPGIRAACGRAWGRLTKKGWPPAWQSEPVSVTRQGQLFDPKLYQTNFALLRKRTQGPVDTAPMRLLLLNNAHDILRAVHLPFGTPLAALDVMNRNQFPKHNIIAAGVMTYEARAASVAGDIRCAERMLRDDAGPHLELPAVKMHFAPRDVLMNMGVGNLLRLTESDLFSIGASADAQLASMMTFLRDAEAVTALADDHTWAGAFGWYLSRELAEKVMGPYSDQWGEYRLLGLQAAEDSFADGNGDSYFDVWPHSGADAM